MRQTTDYWHAEITHTQSCSAPLQSWIMSLSGCAAVLRVSNQSVQEQSVQMCPNNTRPVKPRQSGRTILIRNAKQYISFHMPTLTTSKQEAGCYCDAALSQTHYRSTQVNHHELMQRHQCHIRCEDTDSIHAALYEETHRAHTQRTNVWQELIGLPMLTALIVVGAL